MYNFFQSTDCAQGGIIRCVVLGGNGVGDVFSPGIFGLTLISVEQHIFK